MSLVTHTIVDLSTAPESLREQAAQLLVAAFRENWPEAWPTLEDAWEEVNECATTEDWVALAAVSEDGKLLGWVGGRPDYAAVWELQPLAIDESVRRQGIARALVTALEEAARARGAVTLWLGTDDENGLTSLAGVDIYDNLPERLASIRNLNDHPYSVYERLGFKITGVMPDANGYGKPDILMAKRISG